MFKSPFSSKPSSDAEAAALSSIRIDFARMLIEPSPRDLERALDSWSWLKTPEPPPLLVSAFGDLFFSQSGRVVMVDMLLGKLMPVARSLCELREKLGQENVQDKLLRSVWIQSAWRRGVFLEPGECYDWKVAPALGGAISADQIVNRSFVVKVSIAGQLHRQLKDWPPGKRISGFEIADQ